MRDGEGVALGVGVFFEDDFFLRLEFGDAAGDFSSEGEEAFFFFEDALAEGEGFGVADFFFRCGVGVGVAKAFLMASPMDCSAAHIGAARDRISPMIESGRRNIPKL